MANQRDIRLSQNRQLLPGSDADLPLNKIQTSDHFCDRMLNLQTGIHFHKVKFVSVCVKDEFDCTRIVIPNSLCSCNCCLAHLSSKSI